MNRLKCLVVLGLIFSGRICSAQGLHDAASSVQVHKTVDDVDLKVWIFNPAQHEVGDMSPAIVFFFGGGWRAGNPNQFLKHCEYLAARGMVAMTADYRVLSRHGVPAHKCVADAKSIMRWMRGNAQQLGIDPEKIVAAGGSAGGHLAAATALISGFDDPTDNLSLSAQPNALALFNPAVILADVAGVYQVTQERREQMPKRMGTDPVSLSPYHHLRKGICPTIIFHGMADNTVKFETVQLFDQAMDDLGNTCNLIGYEGESHGFFNYRRDNARAFTSTLYRLDQFLADLGYLHPLLDHQEK